MALVRRAVAATVLLRSASVDVVGALASGDGRATALARRRNPRGARWTREAAVIVFRLSR